jgi:hypothetical protein
VKKLIEGLDPVAVGQQEVDQYLHGATGILPSFPGQLFQAREAAPHPLDLKGPVARVEQCIPNGLGIRGVFLHQEYVVRHQQLAAIKL